jgi:hypothetical protein
MPLQDTKGKKQWNQKVIVACLYPQKYQVEHHKLLGESTLHPPKIVVTKIKILHLVFLGTCGHHILDLFFSFQVHCINFRLKIVF